MPLDTKYNPDKDPQELIAHMSKGYSFESFGGNRTGESVARSTLYEWVKTYKEFKLAKEIGEGKALHYFEKLLRLGLVGETELKGYNDEFGKPKKIAINSRLIQFALKTRFHEIYSERQKLEVDGLSTSMDGINKESLAALAKAVRQEIQERGLSNGGGNDENKSN